MAEYAGLEIRIGGDTTKLNNALKASTKSAADLQSRIRQITHAMQFDPTDLDNVATRIKLTGDRMQSLQSKTQLVKRAMEQLGEVGTPFKNVDGTTKTIKQLAEDTDNLSLKTKQADERFVGLEKTLAKIYEAWNRSARAEGKDFAQDQLGIDSKTAEYLMSTTTSLRDFRTELNNINDARIKGFDTEHPIITPEELAKITQLKELNFHRMFENGLELDDLVAEARDLGVAIEDSAVASVRDLQKTFKDAQDEKKAFDEALKFEQMGTDVQRLESEAESLSQTMRKLDDGLNNISRTDEFQSVETQIRSVDAALDNVEQDLQRTSEAMKLDPKSVQLAARYFNDLQQQEQLTKEKAELLNKQMEMLDASGASEAAKGHQDLAKWVEESAEAARAANKEWSEQKATVANLDDEVRRLQQNIRDMKGNTVLNEYSDNVQRWQRQTERLEKAMDDLATAEEKVAEQQTTLGQARDSFEKRSQDAEEYKTKLEELKRRQEELKETMQRTDLSDDDMFAAYEELGKVSDEIKEVGRAYRQASKEAEALGIAFDEVQKLTDAMANDLDDKRKSIDNIKQSISDLEKTSEVKLFKNPTAEIESAETELKGLQAELSEATAEEKKLASAYKAAETENELAKTAQNLRDVSQEANDAQADMKKLASELDVSKTSILNASTVKSLGMTLSATLTPAITAFGYKMVDASSDIDSAYRDMRKTVQGTEEQFEHLKSAAIEFSRTHVTSADQILQIEAIGGELGVATSALETFAEVISNIDVATNLDVEGAADALGHLSNILHLTEDDYVGFSDALVRLGNNGASTETEIANIAERIGSMGAILDMSGSDVLAWASSLASTGQNAEAAATALSKTWSFMETSVAAAGGTIDTSFEAINAAVQEGGDKLTVFANLAGMTADEFAESWENSSEDVAADLSEKLETAKDSLQMIADVAHMSASEFAETWESDPTKATEAFIRGLNDVEAAEGSADKVLQSLGITAVRQKQGIEGLMQTIGGLDDNLKMSEDAWNGVSDKWGQAGDAANEAAKKAEGFSGQVQILKNIFQNFLSELGEGAVPYIQLFTDKISDLSSWFSTLGAGAKTVIVGVGGFLAALGPMLSMGATLATASTEWSKWRDNAISGMNLVKLAFKQGGQEAVDALVEGGSEATSALLKTTSSMEKTKIVAGQLGSSIVEGLAIGAVVAGIALIVSELKKLYDQYQDHIAATEGLRQALNNVGKASDITAASFDGTGTSLLNLAKDSREYESRLADLAQTIKDSNSQYGTYAGQLDYYGSVIEDLGGKTDLSQEEAYKLESALLAVNDACGTTYGLDEYGNIIDTETGKIQESTDAILANIDARRAQALVEYYSDDYAQAVGEYTDATEKLNEAKKEQRSLESAAGKQAYLDRLKEIQGAYYNENDALAAYNYEVSQGREAIANYEDEASKAHETFTRLEGKIASAEAEQRKANETIEEAAAAQEEYDKRSDVVSADVTGNMKRMSDAVDELGKSNVDFNGAVEQLDAIHVSADELGKVDMSKLASSFDGSMSDVIATLEEGGVQMNSWNSALEQAPGAAENMSSITAAAFDSMYEIAGNDLNATMTLIAGLDGMQIGDKTFYIGDNGSIVDEQGKVYDISADIASIPDEVITTYYGDNKDAVQKALEAKKKAKDVGDTKVKSEIGVTDNATSKISPIQKGLDGIAAARPTASAYLNDYASAKIADLKRKYDSLPVSKTVTIYQNTIATTQATGGMNNRPVIPKHASGYIATGPTMTNQGWIGEDGIEAVANWATGGAVVPLTNKKYMLPIADAIADGMASRSTSGGPTINISITGVSGPDEVADAITRELSLLGIL